MGKVNILKMSNDFFLLYFENEDTGEVIATHKPFGKQFKQYKRIKENCIIVRETDESFPVDKDGSKRNIYCLDDDFKIKWQIKPPMKKDSFPNDIDWDKETKRRKKLDGYLTLDRIESFSSFICSSWNGFLVTVDYETGRTLNAEFTRF